MTEPAELARAAQARLARTVNFGPDLGAELERGWTIDIQRSHLEACAQAGFTAVRLLIYLTAHRTAAGWTRACCAASSRSSTRPRR